MSANNERILLTADAVINLALGILLLLSPKNIFGFLGIPIPFEPFYARLLGAVLLGIGLALILERYKNRYEIAGLGLEGAIIINIFGAGTLSMLLLSGGSLLPLIGQIILWSIALIILIISVIELIVVRNRLIKR